MRTNFSSKMCLTLPVVAALVLSGCGGEDEPTVGAAAASSPSASAEQAFNAADIEFANGMIPHHAQAVDMAALASTKAASPKVKENAERIKASQDQKIETLTGFLSSWGEPVPSSDQSASMDGMDHEAAGHSGMMSSEDMSELEGARAAEFDRLWVEMMITHHEGAVEMSEAQVRAGRSEQAKQLARTIAETQAQEITELRSLDLS